MRVWADECVTPLLVRVAQERNYVATCNRDLGLTRLLDPQLYKRVTEGDWVLVTNNDRDFRPLAQKAGLHAGLIAISQADRDKQPRDFEAILDYIEAQAEAAGEEPGIWMINRVVEQDEDGTIDHAWLP